MILDSAFYEKILEATQDGVWVTDKNDVIFYANRAMSEIAGIPIEKIIGNNVLRDFPLETTEQFNKCYLKAKTNLVSESYEVTVKTPAGKDSWQNGWVIPKKDSSGKFDGMITSVRDISLRKEVEIELTNQLIFLDTIMTESPFSMWIADAGGTIIKGNNALFKSLNLDEAQIVGKYNVLKDENLIGQGLLPKIKDVFENNIPAKFTIFWKAEDAGDKGFDTARDLWLSASLFPLINNNGKTEYVVCQWVDITDSKVAEKDLRESEQKYKATYDNAPLAFQSLNNDAIIIDVNPTWLKTLGYERSETIGKWFGDFLHPEYISHFKKSFPAFKKKGTVSDVQFEMKKKDGTYISVSFEGCVAYTPEGKFKQTYCTFKDITQNKIDEKALKESEERFNLAMQASNDGLYDWNLQTNEIYYSPGWKRMLGYANNELPNDFSIWETLTKPEDVAKSWEMQQELIAKKRDRFVMEFQMKHKDGHWIEVLSR
ncbi:MAG: PAS domain S-box protein, partial [Bacteroidetes bacterium]|nr:PAS domain S-box protein [Bacteroidota bacterium]